MTKLHKGSATLGAKMDKQELYHNGHNAMDVGDGQLSQTGNQKDPRRIDKPQ